MNESEQAQAIAEIKDRHEYEEAQIFRHGVQEDDKFNDIATLLEIVDSQAQKIAEQAKKIERIESDLRVMNEVISYNPMIMEKK